jgi:uncharacterized protein HemY
VTAAEWLTVAVELVLVVLLCALVRRIGRTPRTTPKMPRPRQRRTIFGIGVGPFWFFW